MAVVLHHSRAKGTAKLVLLGIANHEGDGGAYPSIATLARYANVHERNAQRAVEQLVAKGELVVAVMAGGDRECPEHLRPNAYRVMVSCPSWCDRTAQHRDTRGRAPRLFLNRLSTPVDNPVADSPPGGGEGVALPPPGGVAVAPPKPSMEPATHEVVPQLGDTRACAECGNPERKCQRVQVKWQRSDRHDYRPVTNASR